MWICLSKTPDADRVIKINYARWLCGRFHNVWSSFQTPLNSIFKRLFWNSQANPLGIESSVRQHRLAHSSTGGVQPSAIPSADLEKGIFQPNAIAASKSAWTFGATFSFKRKGGIRNWICLDFPAGRQASACKDWQNQKYLSWTRRKQCLLVWVCPGNKRIQTPYALVRVHNETTSPEINH